LGPAVPEDRGDEAGAEHPWAMHSPKRVFCVFGVAVEWVVVARDVRELLDVLRGHGLADFGAVTDMDAAYVCHWDLLLSAGCVSERSRNVGGREHRTKRPEPNTMGVVNQRRIKEDEEKDAGGKAEDVAVEKAGGKAAASQKYNALCRCRACTTARAARSSRWTTWTSACTSAG
jgi:hypothetical protein